MNTKHQFKFATHFVMTKARIVITMLGFFLIALYIVQLALCIIRMKGEFWDAGANTKESLYQFFGPGLMVNYLAYFTNQTLILSMAFGILMMIPVFRNHKRTNTFGVIVLGSCIFEIIIYWMSILANLAPALKPDSAIAWAVSITEHVFEPLAVIGLFVCSILFQSSLTKIKFKNMILYSLIHPTILSIYVVALNFIPLTYGNDVYPNGFSLYGPLTNCNPMNTQQGSGTYLNLLLVLALYAVIIGFCCSFWAIDKLRYKIKH